MTSTTILPLLALVTIGCSQSPRGEKDAGGPGSDMVLAPSADLAVPPGGDLATGPSAWTLQINLTSADLYGIWGTSSSNVLVVGGYPPGGDSPPGVRLTWDGAQWSTDTSFIQYKAVTGSGPNAIAVGAYGGDAAGCSMTVDGSHWSNDIDTIFGGTLRGVWSPAGSTAVFAVGENGLLRYSSSYGMAGTWKNDVASPTTSNLYAVWGSSPSDIYAVGGYGTIVHTTSGTLGGNATWSAGEASVADLHAIWGTSANDIYVVGGDPTETLGTILHSTDGGASWPPMIQPALDHPMYAIGGTSSTNLYAVGKGGAIYHSTGDDHWSAEPSPTTQDLLGIWAAPSGELYAVGRAGTILKK